jgi:para-nitrobenzyl esterase
MTRWVLVAAVLGTIGLDAQIGRPIPGDPVTVDGGKVAGTLLQSGVRAYFGIPFAAPPVGDLRWREPQPVKAWSGVYAADRMGAECIQALRNHDINHYFGEEATSEDCLYLNVWAPATAAGGQRLPVIVFIYGGGFTIGSSGMANYGGEQLARKGVVFVNFNYRVGALGFMAHPALTAERPQRASGNWGLLDQVAALEWIGRNIARFGGDPARVTIVGQSAGAASVSYLQASPLARGLVHRVFGMSGNAIVPGPGRTASLADAEAAGSRFQALLQRGSIAAMRQLAADRILAAQNSDGAPRFQPVVDGRFLPQTPQQIFDAGRQNDVPVLLGYMRDENPGMLQTIRYWAQAQVKSGKAPVFVNRFSRVHPYVEGVTFSDHDPKTVGAYHTGEVPYWLKTQDVYNRFRQTRNWTPYDRDLAEKLSDALVAFAATGNPSTPALTWPRYDPANEQMLDFGDAIRTVPMAAKGSTQ